MRTRPSKLVRWAMVGLMLASGEALAQWGGYGSVEGAVAIYPPSPFAPFASPFAFPIVRARIGVRANRFTFGAAYGLGFVPVGDLVDLLHMPAAEVGYHFGLAPRWTLRLALGLGAQIRNSRATFDLALMPELLFFPISKFSVGLVINAHALVPWFGFFGEAGLRGTFYF
jgi:hypothetical protein